MRYFHGGAPGFKVGGLLLPPDRSGTTRTLSRYAAQVPDSEHAQRRDVVYLTAVRDVARAYAAFHPDGALYEAEPHGVLEPDPDHAVPGVSWQCPEAVILRVVDPVVLFRARTVESWLRMLTKVQP